MNFIILSNPKFEKSPGTEAPSRMQMCTDIFFIQILLHGDKACLDDQDNHLSRTPLYMAVRGRQLDILQMLITAGAGHET